MKKLILLGLALVLFIGCQNSAKQFTMSSPEIDEVKALVKDYHAGDWEAWATHYADTAKIFHNTWDENKSTTPQETINNLKDILSNMSSYHFEEDNELPWYEMVTNDEGSVWVYFWGNWQGTFAANGKVLELPVHLALKFENGKIVREEGFYNLADFNTGLQEIEAAKAEAAESEDNDSGE